MTLAEVKPAGPGRALQFPSDLVDAAPGAIEDLPAYFAGCSAEQLRRCWVGLVVSLVFDEDGAFTTTRRVLASVLASVRDGPDAVLVDLRNLPKQLDEASRTQQSRRLAHLIPTTPREVEPVRRSPRRAMPATRDGWLDYLAAVLPNVGDCLTLGKMRVGQAYRARVVEAIEGSVVFGCRDEAITPDRSRFVVFRLAAALPALAVPAVGTPA